MACVGTPGKLPQRIDEFHGVKLALLALDDGVSAVECGGNIGEFLIGRDPSNPTQSYLGNLVNCVPRWSAQVWLAAPRNLAIAPKWEWILSGYNCIYIRSAVCMQISYAIFFFEF